MYRIVAVGIIMIWSVCATAAEWKVVADTHLGTLKLDAASVSRQGRFTTAVLVYEFKEQQMLHVPSKPLFNKRQDDVLVDCSKPTLGIQTSYFYDSGKLTHTLARKDDEVSFSTPAPDTMALTVFDAVCAAAKSRP